MNDDAREYGCNLIERTNKELRFVEERNNGRKAEGEEIPKKELRALSEIATGLLKVNLDSDDAPTLITALLEAIIAPRNADLVLSLGLMRDIKGFLSLHKVS